MADKGAIRKKSMQQKLFLLFLFACLPVVWVRFRKADAETLSSALACTNGQAITASVSDGFYDTDLDVTLGIHMEIPDGARIRYTLNGDDPSGKSDVYTKPIHLDLPEEGEKLVPLKARIFYQDEISGIYSWTYILGQNLTERYTMPVISITCSFKNLYSYENGILADGISKDMARVMGRSTYSVGNYFERGDAWVRDAHVTMFSEDGAKLLKQGIGLSISGGSSRARSVKSFKITAGTQYDENYEKFRLDIFQNTESDTLSYVNEFTNLKLRTTDMRVRTFSGALGEKLAAESGFDGYQFSRPAILYLNGDFYSLIDLMPSLSDSFISHRFSLPDAVYLSKYKKVENTVFDTLSLTSLFEADLTKKANREALEEKVDMDDYLLYYALQVLMNNTDWPGNNFEVWRYEGISSPENRYTDGRARFLMYDIDFIYSRGNVDDDDRGQDVFVNLMEREYYASVSAFSNVMQAKVYRDRFATIVTDLLNTVFDSAHVKSCMEQIYIAKRKELITRLGESTDESMLRYIQDAEKIADARKDELAEDFEAYFGMSERYTAQFTADEGVSISWNQMNVRSGERYSCDYYKDVTISCRASADPGYSFSYWLVNGEKVESRILKINGSEAVKGKTTVHAVAERKEGPLLLIEELSAKSSADWIRLANAGTEELDLTDYFLSDDPEEPMKYRLPEKVLLPGESVVINGKNNYYALGDYIFNFNIKYGETLYLYDRSRRETSTLYVPRMSAWETYGRVGFSNEFVYYNNLDDMRKTA